MWKCVPDFPNPIVDIILSIVSDRRAEEARIAAEEAAMWRSLFWVAVIVIAVLAFIIWKKHHDTPEKS